MKANRISRELVKGAVSAVIGVILMVAITVAVATTVYVYVSGMIGGEKDHTANIGCIIDSSTNRITITTAAANIQWKDIAVVTDNTTVNWRVYNTSGNPIDAAKSTSGAIADIGAGDYIELDFTANPGMSGNVRVSIRYIPTNTLLGSWIITV
jgi:FlaG/FlaF family flagellin (archaellin)